MNEWADDQGQDYNDDYRHTDKYLGMVMFASRPIAFAALSYQSPW